MQLSSGGESYFLDTMLLPADDVASILDRLKGKTLYVHNGIFDLPRIKRHYGVNLTGEDIRDTLLPARLLRSGQ